MMNVQQAMQQRHSVRAYLPKKVDAALLRQLLAQAGQAASGGNLQPWRVVALAGASLQALGQAMRHAAPNSDPVLVYPAALWEPYRSRRFENGEDLYRSIGIERDDKQGRLMQLAQNTQMIGAPVGVFVAGMGVSVWPSAAMHAAAQLTGAGVGLAVAAAGMAAFLMSVDFPRSRARFSRLTVDETQA